MSTDIKKFLINTSQFNTLPYNLLDIKHHKPLIHFNKAVDICI